MAPNDRSQDTVKLIAGRYEELNAFGVPTGAMVEIGHGGCLPSLPGGFTWRLAKRPRISDLSTTDLSARAAEYRQMATTATAVEVRDALLRISERFSDMALERALNSCDLV
jgi:hypothetical protein